MMMMMMVMTMTVMMMIMMMMPFSKSWEFHSKLTSVICHDDLMEHVCISPMYTFSLLLVQR